MILFICNKFFCDSFEIFHALGNAKARDTLIHNLVNFIELSVIRYIDFIWYYYTNINEHRRSGVNFYPYVSNLMLWLQLCRLIIQFITQTRLFKYTENFTSKSWKFSDKKLWYFSYFCSKHRLWVLVRTEAVLTSTHNLCFWSEIRK